MKRNIKKEWLRLCKEIEECGGRLKSNLIETNSDNFVKIANKLYTFKNSLIEIRTKQGWNIYNMEIDLCSISCIDVELVEKINHYYS